jgi:hypothetical protein
VGWSTNSNRLSKSPIPTTPRRRRGIFSRISLLRMSTGTNSATS